MYDWRLLLLLLLGRALLPCVGREDADGRVLDTPAVGRLAVLGLPETPDVGLVDAPLTPVLPEELPAVGLPETLAWFLLPDCC